MTFDELANGFQLSAAFDAVGQLELAIELRQWRLAAGSGWLIRTGKRRREEAVKTGRRVDRSRIHGELLKVGFSVSKRTVSQ